jgi:tetratricopeptide (TPR) repeat protein
MIGILIAIIGVLLALVGIIVAVVIPLLQSRARKKRILKKHFKIIWKKSSALKPKALLELRPFHKAYHKRDEDDKILQTLSAQKSVLIVGPPLSGKTRAVHRALRKLNKPCDVLIARAVDIDVENFLFPRHLRFWRPKVLVIDDLHRFVELQNFEHLFRAANENNTPIVATCRSGFECDKAKAKIGERSLDFDTVFGENVFELGKVSQDEAQKVASDARVDWAKVRFDGTIGSVFMKLSTMETRFKNSSPEEKTFLRVLRKLYLAGVYEENQVFPLKWVKAVAKTDELEGSGPQWNEWMEKLQGKEFITRRKDAVQAEEVYLQDIVKPGAKVEKLDLFESMLAALTGLADALFRLGSRAYGIGETRLDKANYMKIAIAAYQEALKVYTLEDFPDQHAMTQRSLGSAYRILAEVESKADNCMRAIKAHKAALKFYSLKQFPVDYASIQNNLGNAYRTLGEVEAKAENCKLAIAAYQEALKVYTLERFPMQYGATQNNLGNAYVTLGEVEAKAENCKLAIGAYQEALKVRTLERFPMEYGATQNNLGTAYWTLAEEEAKAHNCGKAKTAFQEALKAYTKEELPLDYRMAQDNLRNLRDFCEGK